MRKCAVFGVAAAMLSLAGARPAAASLLQENYKTAGDGLITLDTATSLEWLDAPVTLGESPDQALAANPGFELATLPEVTTLLEDAGIAAGDINAATYFTADQAAQDTLSQDLGLTEYWAQYYGPAAAGWEYQGFGNVVNSAGTGWGQETLDTRNPPLGGDGAYSSFTAFNNSLAGSGSNNFDFLVESTTISAAPEPGSVCLLFGAGLLGIGMLRKPVRRMRPGRWILAVQSVLLAGAALHPAAASAQGTGYWHTSGSQILDSNNTPVRISGLNWYGFETTDFIAHGLWAQDYKSILETVKTQGYNTIRIPFSNQMVESNPVPTNLSFYNTQPINTDLRGQTSLVILDKIIAYCGQIGLRVILDNHRSEAGNSAEDNGLWYTSAYPESQWISDWVQLASRYNGNTTVIGFDLRNEPHNSASWGDNNAATDWRAAAERAGNAVLGVNPNLLIFVEGIQNYNNNYYWWGGNLEGAGQYPVQLSVANRVVYSAHDYGPDLSGQSWFNGSTTTASLDSVWTTYWAYLSIDNIAPVWLGEFGTTNNSADIAGTSPGSQGQWFQSMIQFLAAHPAIDWTYWALNGEDTFGLLDSNYDPIPASAQKQQALASIQFALSGSGGGTPDFTIGVTPASQTVTAGGSAAYTVTLGALNGYSGAVSLTAPGLPSGITAGFSSSQVNPPGTATLTLTAGTSVAPGSYVVTVTGTAGTLTHSTAVNFVVQAAPVPDFSLSASPGPQSVTAGSQVSWTISSAPLNGFAGSVGLSVSGLPTGAAATFAPASVSGGGNSSLTISTTSQTAAGSYQVVVTGTSGNLRHSLSLTLNVTPATSGGGCTVTWQVYSDWGVGFVVGLTLQNNTGAAISNWTLGWTFNGNQQITNLWNGQLTQAGQAVTVANESYNGSIANGGNTQLGFQAAYSGSNVKPSAITMNGTSCSVQ